MKKKKEKKCKQLNAAASAAAAGGGGGAGEKKEIKRKEKNISSSKRYSKNQDSHLRHVLQPVLEHVQLVESHGNHAHTGDANVHRFVINLAETVRLNDLLDVGASAAESAVVPDEEDRSLAFHPKNRSVIKYHRPPVKPSSNYQTIIHPSTGVAGGLMTITWRCIEMYTRDVFFFFFFLWRHQWWR